MRLQVVAGDIPGRPGDHVELLPSEEGWVVIHGVHCDGKYAGDALRVVRGNVKSEAVFQTLLRTTVAVPDRSTGDGLSVEKLRDVLYSADVDVQLAPVRMPYDVKGHPSLWRNGVKSVFSDVSNTPFRHSHTVVVQREIGDGERHGDVVLAPTDVPRAKPHYEVVSEGAAGLVDVVIEHQALVDLCLCEIR